MHALTRTVLSHRRAVIVIWLLLAVAGAVTARTTIGRLTTSYALAGSPGYAASQRIAALYGNGGAAAPTVAVITLPAGLTADSRDVAAEAGRVFAAGHAVPHVRIADYATTGDRAFVTAGARSTFALVFTPGNQPDTLQPADIAVARAAQDRGDLAAAQHAYAAALDIFRRLTELDRDDTDWLAAEARRRTGG